MLSNYDLCVMSQHRDRAMLYFSNIIKLDCSIKINILKRNWEEWPYTLTSNTDPVFGGIAADELCVTRRAVSHLHYPYWPYLCIYASRYDPVDLKVTVDLKLLYDHVSHALFWNRDSSVTHTPPLFHTDLYFCYQLSAIGDGLTSPGVVFTSTWVPIWN